MDKELVRHFIEECKEDKEWKERWDANHIDMDDWFKYSGEIEETKALISQWVYGKNHRCNDLHEKFIKIKQLENENNIKNEK